MKQSDPPRLDALFPVLSGCCDPLVSALQAGVRVPALGLRRAARLPVTAALHAELDRPTLLITDRPTRALALAEEIALWAPDASRLLFPEPTPLFYEDAAWGETSRRDRLVALTTLASYHIPGAIRPPSPPLIIAPARALMTRTLPRHALLKATRTLRVEQIIQIDTLARTCLTLGYEAVNTVIAPGRFARRGGIMDLWPPVEDHPIRLEFFGDEIDTMRYFDPATQRTSTSGGETPLSRILLTPAREYLLKPEMAQQREGAEFSEFDIPLLHNTPASLLDYLPRDALVLIDDHQALEDLVTEIEEQAVSRRQEFDPRRYIAGRFPNPIPDLGRNPGFVEPPHEPGPGLSFTGRSGFNRTR